MRITTRERGFTLIELMIVVSIIGILASMALPTYKEYIKRARFAEVIAATQPYKIAVSLALQLGEPLAELQNTQHGIPPQPTPTNNLQSLSVDNGTITATATALAGSATYILKPNADGSTFTISGSCLKSRLCEE